MIERSEPADSAESPDGPAANQVSGKQPTLPDGLSQVRILVVDDNVSQGANLEKRLRREFQDLDLTVERVTTFTEGEQLLRTRGFDLAVLDVRLGDSVNPEDPEAGRKVFERVSKAQWLPVVFWTAIPTSVEDLARPPLVQVANKNQIRDVPGLVRAALRSGVPQFARQISAEMDTVVRNFLRDMVADQWNEMDTSDQHDVLPLLANRLSFYLRNGFLDRLKLIGGPTDIVPHASSARYYLLPPVSQAPTTGDVYAHGDEWWVLVTPQCDMETRNGSPMKAEHLRLARAVPPRDTTIGSRYVESKSNTAKGDLKRALGDHHRFFFLPAYLAIPDLLVDFEQVSAFPRSELLPSLASSTNEKQAGMKSDHTAWDRKATIDAPYSQALLYRLSRAVSRIGIEELPTASVVQQLDDIREQS